MLRTLTEPEARQLREKTIPVPDMLGNGMGDLHGKPAGEVSSRLLAPNISSKRMLSSESRSRGDHNHPRSEYSPPHQSRNVTNNRVPRYSARQTEIYSRQVKGRGDEGEH